jgi:ABC-type transport system involved in multi-copper enzyme maturation permease subunit
MGGLRLFLTLTVLPAISIALCVALFVNTSVLLLHPPDVGSEGKDVIDLDQEAQQAVGLVIQPDQFPDMLFAPPKRTDLMADEANPVYDKEIRSEIFSQGTLMLRLVIQVSMVLAIPFMAVCLYIYPQYAPWYIGYVVMFNMLVGPVFSAGSVTSERERETLDLLLTTVITPWQILWGKLVAGLRISSVLTLFLVWPVLLACVMVSLYWNNLVSVLGYLLIVLLTCCTTAMLALFCSVIVRKTSIALMSAYLAVIVLFCAPLAISFFFGSVYQAYGDAEGSTGGANSATRLAEQLSFTSPFAAAFALPLDTGVTGETAAQDAAAAGNWGLFLSYVVFTVLFNLGLLAAMIWLFRSRWRVAT